MTGQDKGQDKEFDALLGYASDFVPFLYNATTLYSGIFFLFLRKQK